MNCLIRTVFAGAVGGCALLATGKTITVAADGSGDFKTIQEAVAAVPDNSAERIVIHLKPGSYQGQIVLPKAKSKVTVEGEGTDKSFIKFGYNTNEPNPQGIERQFWGIGMVVQSEDFIAHDLTFQNTSGDHGQALALRIDGDRAVVFDSRLLGWQDTLMVNNGRQYFRDDYIEGRVDFIYGSGTAVFEHCEIHSKNGGHITAANTPQDHPYGLIFLDCKLTGDRTPWDPATTNPSTKQKPKVTPEADLGRPWRPYAMVAFVHCEIGNHIKPTGWNNWGKETNEHTARYNEYGNTGPGAATEKRVAWSHQMSPDEAAKLTVQNVLSGQDNWDPKSLLPNMTAK